MVVYPDMYKGMFSFFSFNSGPSVSQFASERPANAPPPKPKLNPELIDDKNVPVASSQQQTEEAIDAQGSQTEQMRTDKPMEAGDNPTPDQVSTTETPNRSRRDRSGNRETKPAIAPRISGGRNPRGFRSERPGAPRRPIARQPTVSATAIPEAPTAAATESAVAVSPSEESPTEQIPEPVVEKQTLVRIDSLEAVSFSPEWDLIESSRSPIPVVVATHARQSEMGIKFDCLLYTSPSPRDATLSRMPSSA